MKHTISSFCVLSTRGILWKKLKTIYDSNAHRQRNFPSNLSLFSHAGCGFLIYCNKASAINAINAIHERHTLPGVSKDFCLCFYSPSFRNWAQSMTAFANPWSSLKWLISSWISCFIFCASILTSRWYFDTSLFREWTAPNAFIKVVSLSNYSK